VVLFDRLVDQELLELVPHDAELVDVGKDPATRPGGKSTAQQRINELLIDRARSGLRVVRLKGGDPFVFGRGSEELAACQEAGVLCEVVPGVTSALAAPAVDGVPVTARRCARSFAVVTARGGEETAGEAAHTIDYRGLSSVDTVVVLMGCERLEELVAGFLGAGWSPQTPACLVERATWPVHRSIRGSLAEIVDFARVGEFTPPAVLIVGATASRRFLAGRTMGSRTILVTRPRSASSALVSALRLRGASVIECPLIRVEPIEPLPMVPALARFDWIVFTSLHAVRAFAEMLRIGGGDARTLSGVRIAAVGPRTAAELWSLLRLRADLVPTEHRAAALSAALLSAMRNCENQPRVLFPCGTLAREELALALRARSVEVEELVVYRTLLQPPTPEAREAVQRIVRLGDLDAVLLYSPSAVRSLVEHQLDVDEAAIVCVGPTTAAAAAAAGLGPIVVPERYGDQGVIEALERHFNHALPGPSSTEGVEGGRP
jgi:uroporphyrinogen III methyltransferase/synthase